MLSHRNLRKGSVEITAPPYVIILAAGLHRSGIGQPRRAEQLCEAAMVWARRRADAHIFVTGGKKDSHGKTEGELLADYLVERGFPGDKIQGEYHSMDMHAGLLDLLAVLPVDAPSVGLVVIEPQSARAARVFKKLYPEVCFRVIPVYPQVWDDTTQWGLRSPLLVRMREVVAYIVFFLQGKL
jgi:hypothetical protein